MLHTHKGNEMSDMSGLIDFFGWCLIGMVLVGFLAFTIAMLVTGYPL